ncbi:hypothetical protein E3N88_37784 [Mikania micrantha]|uniref:Tf2-1-like SH3-like domain-containing protein n=1 Tax=Mikania micrantha TaxID=192012 RepID=A0A5N6LS26_9ASTR|nr:hypothetical protein E3N88_37784 [Mikania micrantha]
MAQVGKVAYRFDLSDELSGIYPTFHVSHLRKCLADDVAYVPLNDIEVDEKLNYIEEQVAIVDMQEKRLRNKMIRQVKVQWKHRKGSESTWETEDEMKRLYPHLFETCQTSRIAPGNVFASPDRCCAVRYPSDYQLDAGESLGKLVNWVDWGPVWVSFVLKSCRRRLRFAGFRREVTCVNMEEGDEMTILPLM